MRMRSHVKVILGLHLDRSKVIEKHEVPDSLLADRGKQPPHHHAAPQIVHPGLH